jgi:hypothetical protein
VSSKVCSFCRLLACLELVSGRGKGLRPLSLAWLVAWLGMVVAAPSGWTAETNRWTAGMKLDLGNPPLFTGTFYELGSHRKKVMFHFRRTAVTTGDLISVDQVFTRPDGSVACREHIEYRHGQLASYAMQDLPAHFTGNIQIKPDPKKPQRQMVYLESFQGAGGDLRTQKNSEVLQTNTLICDTIYPYLLAHYDELAAGTAVKFHLISLDPADTYTFRLVKESESVWEGHPTLILRMEPSNIILAHWLRPIHFTLEKAPPHRLFSYTGRTTPHALVGGEWKFVDAEAVFDW